MTNSHSSEDTEGQVIRRSIARRMFGAEEEPTRIGRFAAIRLLGSGGMGRVYAAYDDRLDRRVAVKILTRELAAHEHRVMREAKAMAKLSHPNVVHVYEVGEHGGRLFIAMEFIDGQTLDEWRKAGTRSWREVVEAYRQAARGLAAAHRAGLVHRDFKPRNAMVDEDPEGRLRVRVLDFGLVRSTDDADASATDLASEDPAETTDDSDLTGADNVLGTPAYMAPEQFEHAGVTEAADQFSLCVAAWEALYGARPFRGRTVHALREAVSSGPPPRPADGGGVPAWVHRVLVRGLAADPVRRFASMDDLVAALSDDPAQRRMRWVVAGAAVVGLGLAAYLGRAGADAAAPVCEGAEEALARAWDPARRERARAAFGATPLPYAAAIFDDVAPRLDRYAAQWAEIHADNCRATHVRGDQTGAAMDLRTSCLHHAKVELDAVAGVLESADADVVDHAIDAIGSLPDLSRCSDVARLEARVEAPTPGEAEAVEAVRASLAEAKAERAAGRYARAQARVDEARAQAEGVTYEPVHTEIALERGMVLEKRGEYAEAEAAFALALSQASALEQTKAQADAALMLMYVLGYRLDRSAEALQHRPLLEGLTRDEPLQRAALYNNLGTVFEAQADFAAAEREYRQALQLRTEASGLDDPDTLDASNNLANVLVRLGRYDEGEKALVDLLERQPGVLGAGHPEVAATHNNLAHVYAMQGRFDEAAEQMRVAIDMMVARLGPSHPTVAAWRTNLGNAYHLLGRYAEAEAEHRRAIEALQATVGPDHAHVLLARANLAAALVEQGELEEAERLQREVLQARLATLGEAHPEVAMARDGLGASLLEHGDAAAAEALFRDALGPLETSLGAEHPQVAGVREHLGVALATQERYAEAEPHVRAAIEALVAVAGDDHPDVASARVQLVQLLVEDGRADEAVPIAEKAWAILRDGDVDDARAAAAFALARALWAGRDDATSHQRARDLATAALEAHASAPDDDGRTTIRDWLAARP